MLGFLVFSGLIIALGETNRRSLKDISVLDYGCGYGRIMRPLYYFTNPDNIHGVDPWDRSIEICRDDGLLGHITLSDYLPEQLPVSRTNFDLIYAYSVFTHTSRKATIAALTALRQVIAPSGLLVLTTRPIEWWSERPIQEQRAWNAHDQITAHRRDGFAFFPSTWNMPADGESIFGDTSMTADWINHACRSWHVIAYDRGIDPMQTIFVLAPK